MSVDARAGARPRQVARALLELARPEQWIKNGFVLLPLIFAHAAFDPVAVRGALIAVLAFCFASSAVYAGNDLVDVERDRRHPEKCRRPLARGAIGPGAARLFAILAAAAGLIVAAIDGWSLVVVIALYLALQVAYTLALKRVAYLDAIVLACGFLLRIVGGGVGPDIPLTPWIVVVGFLVALLLALGKRQGDLAQAVDPAARATRGYRLAALNRALVVVAIATLGAYVLYTVSPDVLARHGSHPLVWSTPWVALGLLRYLWLALRRGAGGNPSRLVLRDRWLLLAVAGWLVTLGLILYG